MYFSKRAPVYEKSQTTCEVRRAAKCKCQCDLIPAVTMSEAICTKPQEEYEDDFEKDLDWLISEEGRNEDQVNETLVYLATHFLLHFSTAVHRPAVSTAALTALCESLVASVELRRAGMSLCFARETYSADIQRRSSAGPSLHAILKDTLRHVSYRLITLVTC